METPRSGFFPVRESLNIIIQFQIQTGCRAKATRALTTTDVQIGLTQPTDFATVQYFVQLPPIMFGFSESADIGLSF